IDELGRRLPFEVNVVGAGAESVEVQQVSQRPEHAVDILLGQFQQLELSAVYISDLLFEEKLDRHAYRSRRRIDLVIEGGDKVRLHLPKQVELRDVLQQ